MGAPGTGQRRVQRGDGGPVHGLLTQRAGEGGQPGTHIGGQVGGRIGQQRLDLGQHAPGQVAGDRGGLGGDGAQVEEKASRAPRRRGGQLRLDDDGGSRITHDRLLNSTECTGYWTRGDRERRPGWPLYRDLSAGVTGWSEGRAREW